MAKNNRDARWAAAGDGKRRTRRAQFRLATKGVKGIQEQEYVLTADKEELAEPPVYTNSYVTNYRWRHQWEKVSPTE